jgi:hypothetical protein
MMKEGLTFNYPVIRRFLQRVLCRAVLLLSEGKLLDIYKCSQFQLYPMQHGYGYAYRYRKDTDTRIRQFPKKPNTRIRLIFKK